MHHLKFAEFYITNVCDLTCENCNRFNNFQRTGRIDWEESQYVDFAKQFNIDRISIIGGEPLNHPGINDYIVGISKLWPDTGLHVTSNGLAINRRKRLYETCVENNVTLEISLHDVDSVDKVVMAEVNKFTQQNGSDWNSHSETINHIDRDGVPFTTTADYMIDLNGFKIEFTPAYIFGSTSIKEFVGLIPLPHNSDPEDAYHQCGLRNSHTFHDGNLYKCGFIAAGKEFVKSRGAEKHWKKLFDYVPLTMQQYKSDWEKGFFSAEDVCSLCPVDIKYSKCITSIKGKKGK
jgi:organic radical activating enzyme